MDIRALWQDIIGQNKETLPSYFHEDAVIRWHCTNEQFTVSEYVKVNCDYPGNWVGEIERIEEAGSIIVLVGRVFPLSRESSTHVVSFLKLKDDLIYEMDEYWSDDGEAPSWRKAMNIGREIK